MAGGGQGGLGKHFGEICLAILRKNEAQMRGGMNEMGWEKEKQKSWKELGREIMRKAGKAKERQL